MKKNSITIIVLSCMCFFGIATAVSRAEDTESTVNQLNNELQQSGIVTQDEADAIKSSLKDMVEKGARKEELKGVVTEFSNNGVKGNDLKRSVNSMKDLVDEGENPQEAGSVVFQAV